MTLPLLVHTCEKSQVSLLIYLICFKMIIKLDNEFGHLIKTILIPKFSLMCKLFQFPACTIALPENGLLRFWDVEECDKIIAAAKFQ